MLISTEKVYSPIEMNQSVCAFGFVLEPSRESGLHACFLKVFLLANHSLRAQFGIGGGKKFLKLFLFASDRRRKIKRSFMAIKLMLFLRGKARWAPCHYGSFITGQLIDIFHSSPLVMPRK